MNPTIQGRISFYSKCKCEKCQKEVAELKKLLPERQNIVSAITTALEQSKNA
jgi:peroxiredoxin